MRGFFLSNNPKLYLILAIHNHQPVGNFDHIFEESYRKAYLPFLETLNRYPSLKCVLHYSGNLLSWLEKRYPEAFEMIGALVREERVELLSGGFYEPVLSAIPEDDRIPQIKELSGYIQRHLGYSPKGMWLAERVWEPQMPKYISAAGIEYVPVDDHHFRLSGFEEGELLGYYVTEEEGYKLSVFPGSEKLRYMLPFKDVDEIFSYFREIYMRGGNPLLTMADNGEKFGVWPGTYKHCYEDGWLERFFNAMRENSDWVETTTFSEYYSRFQAMGRAYLPTASYREMGEWALPPESALDYEHAFVETQKVMGDKAKSLLRGGIWRSFFVKYPESNHIQKRMFQISKKVHKAIQKFKAQPRIKFGAKLRETHDSQLTAYDLLHELWKGQCNDAYWHGVSGGLYLPHLRSSLYRHLLRAEYVADEILNRKLTIDQSDYDCDGFEDVFVSTEDINLAITEQSGSITELSLKKSGINMLDILTRRPEAYHSKITQASTTHLSETKAIHEQFVLQGADITDYMVYDNYRRTSLIDHFFPYGITIDDLIRSEYEERGDFIEGVYSLKQSKKGNIVTISLSRDGYVDGVPVRIEKTVRLVSPLKLKVDYQIKGRFSGLFAVEFNISFFGSPYPSIIVRDNSIPIRNRGTHDSIKEFYLKDEFENLRVRYNFNEEVDLWHYPVETISLSDRGVERLYQGTAFLFIRKVDFDGEIKSGFAIEFV